MRFDRVWWNVWAGRLMAFGIIHAWSPLTRQILTTANERNTHFDIRSPDIDNQYFCSSLVTFKEFMEVGGIQLGRITDWRWEGIEPFGGLCGCHSNRGYLRVSSSKSSTEHVNRSMYKHKQWPSQGSLACIDEHVYGYQFWMNFNIDRNWIWYSISSINYKLDLYRDKVKSLSSNTNHSTTRCRQVKKIWYIPKNQFHPLVTIQPSRGSMIDHPPPNKWLVQVSCTNGHVVDCRFFTKGIIMARSTSRSASLDSYDPRCRHWWVAFCPNVVDK